MDIARQTAGPDQGWDQHYDVLCELGDCYVSVGQAQQAKDCYEKAADLSPDGAEPYIGLGVIALQESRVEDARIAFRVALRLDGNSSRAYAGLAMIAQQRSLWNEASDLYLKSLELDGDNLTALLGLFQVSCQRRSFEKVIYYLDVYLNLHPGDASVMFCLAALHLKEGRSQKSCDILKDILVLDPGNGEASNLLEEAQQRIIKEGKEICV
jgi:tetratricopeptide (TPR) repeat protein